MHSYSSHADLTYAHTYSIHVVILGDSEPGATGLIENLAIFIALKSAVSWCRRDET